MDYLAAVSAVGAAISASAAVVAVLAARSANRTQKKIQLYDKRRHVFDKTMAFLAQIQVTGRPPEHAELTQFLRDTREVEHLFASDVQDFVQRVHQKASEFRTRYVLWEERREGSYEVVKSCEQQLLDDLVEAKTLFKDYLDVS